MDRRKFLKRTTAASAGALTLPTIVQASALGRSGFTPPSDRIVMAVIGCGSQGKGNMSNLVAKKGVQFVAVCDVDRKHRKQAQGALWKYYKNKDCREYEDYRDVLDKEKIDAASIAVPDHWHAIMYKQFANNKIDIYGEKPLVRKVSEGKEVVSAVKNSGIIWQTGSWQRSRPNFHRACELVRNGVIGKIQHVEVGLPDFTLSVGMPSEKSVPKHLNWDMWLGPAPKRPFRGVAHWDWRWIMEYSGGQLTDWAGHHIDIAFWGLGMDNSGPAEIKASAKFNDGDYYDVPHEFDIHMKMPDGLPIRVANNSKLPKGGGTCWYGEHGWIYVDRGKLDASDSDILQSKIPDNGIRLYKSEDHYQNFVDCVKSRKEAITPATVANRAIIAGLLGEIAFLTGETIHWDPVKEELVNASDKAKSLLSYEYRKPWTL